MSNPSPEKIASEAAEEVANWSKRLNAAANVEASLRAASEHEGKTAKQWYDSWLLEYNGRLVDNQERRDEQDQLSAQLAAVQLEAAAMRETMETAADVILRSGVLLQVGHILKTTLADKSSQVGRELLQRIVALRSASLADKAELEKAKAEDFMKKWCRHIKWDSYVQYDARTTCHVNTPAWVIYCPTPSSSELPVPRSWKVCPVCGAERPTKANTKAAAHCALMDMGDDE